MMRALVVLACLTAASAGNLTFCEFVDKDLPKGYPCDCKNKLKGGVITCQKTVLNDTIGLVTEVLPCDPVAHVSLLVLESAHNIKFPVSNIQAGHVEKVPIPGLAVAIPGFGNAGLDVAADIDGNWDELTVKVGFDACGKIKGHKVCGSQFNKALPVWVLQKPFKFRDFCDGVKHLEQNELIV